MNRSTVRATVEWALWGKQPDGLNSDVLRCSQGRMSAEEFKQIIERFSTGTADESPVVSVSFVSGENVKLRLGIAIQEASDDLDRVGRSIAVTRYFCIIYDELTAGKVSYEALYQALRHRSKELEGTKPFTVDLERSSPELIADRVTTNDMGIAALLLTGANVRITHAGSLSPEQRLERLDTIASLLPYGMRSKFSASTWTSSTVENRLRLAFTDAGRADTTNVQLGCPPLITSPRSAPYQYFSLLTQHPDRIELVHDLAQETFPRGFKDEVDAANALKVLQTSARRLPRKPRPTPHQLSMEVERLLKACATAVAKNATTELQEHLNRLEQVRDRQPTKEWRQRYRAVVAEGQMLRSSAILASEQGTHLIGILLQDVYGPVLDTARINEIEQDTGSLHQTILAALPYGNLDDDVDLVLRISRRIEESFPHEVAVEHKSIMLQRFDSERLVQAASVRPFDEWKTKFVCRELTHRAQRQEQAEEVAGALQRHGHLAQPINEQFPEAEQYELLEKLISAAYPDFAQGRGAFLDVLGPVPTPPTPVLFAVAVELYGHGAGALIPDMINRFLASAGLSSAQLTKLRSHVATQGPPPAFGSAPGIGLAPAGQRSPEQRPPQKPSSPRPEPNSELMQTIMVLVMVTLVAIFVIAIIKMQQR